MNKINKLNLGGEIFDINPNSINDIEGVVSIEKGGTGATTAAEALTSLGITATADELNRVDGVTSSIQTQLNSKKNQYLHKTAIVTNTYSLLPVIKIKVDSGVGTIQIKLLGETDNQETILSLTFNPETLGGSILSDISYSGPKRTWILTHDNTEDSYTIYGEIGSNEDGIIGTGRGCFVITDINSMDINRNSYIITYPTEQLNSLPASYSVIEERDSSLRVLPLTSSDIEWNPDITFPSQSGLSGSFIKMGRLCIFNCQINLSNTNYPVGTATNLLKIPAWLAPERRYYGEMPICGYYQQPKHMCSMNVNRNSTDGTGTINISPEVATDTNTLFLTGQLIWITKN